MCHLTCYYYYLIIYTSAKLTQKKNQTKKLTPKKGGFIYNKSTQIKKKSFINT